jgi:hypothetical protein
MLSSLFEHVKVDRKRYKKALSVLVEPKPWKMRVYWVVPLVDQQVELPALGHVLARVYTLTEPERQQGHTASTVQASVDELVLSVEEEAHMVSLIYVADQVEAQQAA